MLQMSVDTRAIERRLNSVAASQLPFAAALGINEVAGNIRTAEQGDLERDLEAPTPFTKRGMYVARASKRRLTGVVGFKRVQAAYLATQAAGGTRRAKRRAVVVPVGARRNKYGNMPRGSLKRSLAKPNVFSGTVKGVAGVWRRPDRGQRRDGTRGTKRKNGLTLLAIYKSSVRYQPRLKFVRRAHDRASREIGPAIARHLAQAVITAR